MITLEALEERVFTLEDFVSEQFPGIIGAMKLGMTGLHAEAKSNAEAFASHRKALYDMEGAVRGDIVALKHATNTRSDDLRREIDAQAATVRTDMAALGDTMSLRFERSGAEIRGTRKEVGAVKEDVGFLKSDVGFLMEEVSTFKADVDRRFDAVERRFDGIDRRFDGTDQRLDGVDQRLDGIDQRFKGIDQRFDGMEQRFDNVDQRFRGVDQRFDSLDSKIDTLIAEIRGNRS